VKSLEDDIKKKLLEKMVESFNTSASAGIQGSSPKDLNYISDSLERVFHTKKVVKRPSQGLDVNLQLLNNNVGSFQQQNLLANVKYKMPIGMKGSVPFHKLRQDQKLEFIREINSFFKT